MKCVAIPLHQQYIVHNMYYLAHMNRESTENLWPFAQTQGCKRHSVFKILETLVKKMCVTFSDLPCTSFLEIVPQTQTHSTMLLQ